MNITERFLKYVGYGTNSDEKSETCPSTPNQLVLGTAIAEELKALGLTDVEQDADGYVYGYLPGEGEALGLIAHMDTSPAVSGDHIKPRIVTYPGGVLELGASTLSPTDYPFLEEYIGQELIVTDGTTLLGADDKAGVAEIVTLCEYLLAHPEVKHRPIAVCFTPDEEIGRGTDRFRMDRFPAKEAYTVDGGELGEIEYENFNAAAATVKVRGLNIHPGSAKNKMKNAALLLAEFIGLLPAAETPAHTEGYEGFFHLCEMSGDESSAEAAYIIRDHDREKFETRKVLMQQTADFMNQKYGAGTFTLPLARRCEYVAAVESYGPAVRDLRRNLEIARLDNVDVIGGDAVREFPDEEADLLVVDPPRAGLAPEAIDLIASTPARAVAYVSCDPATLARDLRRFCDQGTFVPVSATPVDLFPQTFHCETVVHLVRR
mgnify:CR=1 FL=1